LLLGIDIGTTGVKAAAFDASGRELAEAYEACPCAILEEGRVEADAEAWWLATTRVCRRIAGAVRPGHVEAIGVVGQAPTAVLVDPEGRTVRPAIVWLDVRAGEEARAIARALGAGPGESVHGNRLHPYYLGPKLAWLRRHEPASLDRARFVLQSHAFVVFRLTGEAACDPSTAMLSTPLYDPATRAWSRPGADAAGIDVTILPHLVRAESVVGRVTRAAAEATGLREGTPVASGGGDFAAAALGSGVVEEGEACLMLGTAGNLLVPRKEPRFDARLINSHHVGVDRWLVLGGTLCGGALEWFRAACAPGVAWDVLEREAAGVPPGAGGVVMLPYLRGERTPMWDEQARGAFFGLDAAHGRGHLFRALVEGIALGFRDCLSVVEEQGVRFREVVANSGGGKSALLRQALADALEIPVVWVPEGDATVTGAAMLAAMALGRKGPSLRREDAVRHEPDRRASEELRDVLERRRALYSATLAARGAR
jgi:xylulokinase